MARLNEPPVAPAAPAAALNPLQMTPAAIWENVDACKFASFHCSSNLTNACALATTTMRTKSRPPKEKSATDWEEVKRRFSRQNLQLAKSNSSQALHIQKLNNEVDKLVAQNQDLKELVLKLQGELQSSRAQAATVRAKVAELTGLVAGLGVSAQEEDADLILSREAVKSPTARQFRERQPLAELMQESQMPTITEDQLFPPRESLDNEDIWTAARLSDHSSNESPDLGPPPVARFACEEPEKSSAEVTGAESARGTTSEEAKTLENDQLLASVETRRKRKDGPTRLEMRRSSVLAHSPVKTEGETATTMLRTGAKRKLADRDGEKNSKPANKDGFAFSRPQLSDDEDSIKVKMSRTTPVLKPESKPARKVLSDKSVNMSPRKAAMQSRGDKAKKCVSDGNEKTQDRTASRPRRTSAALPLPSPPIEVEQVIEIPEPSADVLPTADLDHDLLGHGPDTPAATDFFSPGSSQNSQPKTCDTPPPADLSTASNTTETGQRPSRRARSAVNYAEPSLVAKMRRPGKQMVDAISGLQDPRLVMSSAGEGRKSVGGGVSSSSSTPAPRVVVIKKDSASADKLEGKEWQLTGQTGATSTSVAEAGSPLNNKSGVVLSATCSLRAESQKTARIFSSQTNSSSAASTTASSDGEKAPPSKRPRQSLQSRRAVAPTSESSEEESNSVAAAKRLEEMDLYDFKDTSSSSPASSGVAKVHHRRHSSVSKSALGVAGAGKLSSGASGGDGSTANGGRAERISARRRSMML